MDCFKKIITNYDYADRLKPGGFVIDGKPALTQRLHYKHRQPFLQTAVSR